MSIQMTERGREMAPPIYHLMHALKSKRFIPRMPHCNGDMIITVCHYIIKLCQQDDKVISLLEQLNDSVKKVFIDFLLEIYDGIRHRISDHKDSFESCRMELKFFITFLGDIPTSLDENENVLTDIEAVANDVGSLFYSFFFYIGKKDWTRDNRLKVLALADILRKVEQVKEKIKGQCMAVSWKMLTPKTSVVSLFLFDSLLDDLNLIMIQKYETSIDVKDQIRTIVEELKSLRSFHEDMMVQKHPELEGFLIQTSDIAYEVLYILTSYAPVWYLNLRLPQVMEKIKLIRLPLENLNKYPAEQVSSQDEKPLEDIVVDFHADTNRIAGMLKDVENPSQKAPFIEKDISVGLDDEANEIKEILLGNQKEQQIISIWGMPGLGKTTLAKKIFSDDRIVQHFHIRTSCVISQTYDKKNTLIAILTSMSSLERDELSKLDEDTLGWKNIPKIKVFQDVPCPLELLDIGKKIARNCNGLPLAVVVIAAVLASMKKNKTKWEEVAVSLSSYISKDNSCMKILELSYSYLPMHLKPCFLYFGAFEEDIEIPVQKLISLWVSEGFVQKGKQKNSNDVSYGYLIDLISRGLVQVGKTRSNGGVKTCYVHDLLREMCLKVAEKDNFMKVIKG
ncbi:putative disease resistance protein RXW24L [Abeliophyllum distichum]|uniref:Disease resistance protein RXW24L n=1 Tax=Abeliophyllum distichum TaxID=126358 RepID=A0ABD1T0U5_9LAMI